MITFVLWWVSLAIIPPILWRLWLQRENRRWQWWVLWLPIVCAACFIALNWPSFLVIRKIVAQLLMPPGCLWLAAALLSWIAFERRKWLLGWSFIGIFFCLTISGSRPLGSYLLRNLANHVADNSAQLRNGSIGPFPAAAVLGGGTAVDDAGYPALAAAGDRLRLAAAGYHAGWYQQIITCGSPIVGYSQDPDPQQTASTLLQQMGVPSSAIIPINATTRTTDEELTALAGWLERHPEDRICLITSGWHMPRAMALAERRGITARVVPLLANPTEKIPLNPEKMIPHGQGFEKVQAACWEWLGRLVK